jgi:hypothetical protein
MTGEAFGALSAAVAGVGLRRRGLPAVPGLAALMVVWIGGTSFDGFSVRPFWQDVLGTSTGWSRTFLNTVGLLWMIAIVAGAYLAVVRVAERGLTDGESDSEVGLAGWLAPALVPLGCAWFLAHDLTLLVLEGQNAYALVSDPLGRGWDVFGTVAHTVDYSFVRARWLRWLQLTLLTVGHVGAVVLLHDLALRRLRPRAAMAATWAMAVVTSGSIVAAVMLVLG